MMVAKTLSDVMRSDRGMLLATLASHLRDLALAEDVLQDAAFAALTHWEKHGPPESPQGWLLSVARRKAIDRVRVSTRETRRMQSLVWLKEATEDPVEVGLGSARGSTRPGLTQIPDRRLGLIFACCHPAIELKSRVALTLRTVCGLSTAEIARLFLDAEPTMGQRLSRAKAKIAAAGISFEIPEPADWPGRLNAVLTAVYLIFTTGYLCEPDEPRDLCAEAEYLMRLIDRLHPGDAETEGALAMMLLLGARRRGRVGPDGASVPPAEQDRDTWDWARIHEGRALLAQAIARGTPGPYQLKAAIADCQTFEGGPDWRQIAALYMALFRHEPTPVVQLNAAVAMAETGEATQALAVVESLSESLSDYQPWHAARASLLAKTGDLVAAKEAFRSAIARAPARADVLFLESRLAALTAVTPSPSG